MSEIARITSNSQSEINEERESNLTETLPPPSLDHEVPRQCEWWRWLQRVEDHVPVQRISGHDGPVVEHLLAERLSLCVGPKVSLEAKTNGTSRK
jgi:hypothetical protein